MADQEEPHSLSSTFPNPPPFWKDFTPDRIARIVKLRKAAKKDSGNTNEADGEDGASNGNDSAAGTGTARLLNIPADLINLQPPREPTDGRWRVFGDHYTLDDKLPTLEDQGITNLPATNPDHNHNHQPQPPNTTTSRESKHSDHALELKRLAKSLLLNFLELSGTLSHTPADAPAKVADLRTLFINTHHAINEYRPHQARESAIEMMQEHLDRARGETAAVRTQVDRARRVLDGLGSLNIVAVEGGGDELMKGGGSTEEEGGGVDGGLPMDVEMESEREVWAGVNALFA